MIFNGFKSAGIAETVKNAMKSAIIKIIHLELYRHKWLGLGPSIQHLRKISENVTFLSPNTHTYACI